MKRHGGQAADAEEHICLGRGWTVCWERTSPRDRGPCMSPAHSHREEATERRCSEEQPEMAIMWHVVIIPFIATFFSFKKKKRKKPKTEHGVSPKPTSVG